MLQWQRFLLSLGMGTALAVLPVTVSSPVWAAQKTAAPAKTAKKAVVKRKSAAARSTPRKAVVKKSTRTAVTKKSRSATRSAKAKVSKKVRGKRTARRVVRRPVFRGPSQAMLAGLRNTDDPLDLGSSVAYIVDQDTGEELFQKNADVSLPIASVTKLMTALVIAESGVSMEESVRITREDYLSSRAHSKLRNGMVMKRSELLKAALMSSDNRAAHALARSTPQGLSAFISQMNATARRLGMTDTVFADPTGLDNRNHSTARDLAKLVAAAYEYKDIREASTLSAAQLRAGRYVLNMHTTNRLIGDPNWNIGIQKTGFTTAAAWLCRAKWVRAVW